MAHVEWMGAAAQGETEQAWGHWGGDRVEITDGVHLTTAPTSASGRTLAANPNGDWTFLQQGPPLPVRGSFTRGLKTHTLLFGEGTGLAWHIYDLESRLQAEKMPNMASLYLPWRHKIPWWVACTRRMNPLSGSGTALAPLGALYCKSLGQAGLGVD